MADLQVGRRVAEHLDAVVGRCGLEVDGLLGLRARQPLVEHVLVVVHEAHLALEAGVVVVLGHLEVVAAAFIRRGGQALARWLRHAVVGGVGAQLVIEGALAVAGAVEGPEAAVVAGDVGVTAGAVVGVDDGLGVDVGEGLGRPLFLNDKVTF